MVLLELATRITWLESYFWRPQDYKQFTFPTKVARQQQLT